MIYIIQTLFIAYAYFNAKEEAAWSWPFRNLVFNSDDKERELDKAHDNGAARVVIMMSMASAFGICDYGLLNILTGTITFFLLSGLWYWLVFDIIYALEINQKWHYIGSTADTDNRLNKWFGAKAGKVKAAGCVFFIIGLNVFNILW